MNQQFPFVDLYETDSVETPRKSHLREFTVLLVVGVIAVGFCLWDGLGASAVLGMLTLAVSVCSYLFSRDNPERRSHLMRLVAVLAYTTAVTSVVIGLFILQYKDMLKYGDYAYTTLVVALISGALWMIAVLCAIRMSRNDDEDQTGRVVMTSEDAAEREFAITYDAVPIDVEKV
eukprot:CAMPEP_0194028632 /NCGR_PEP_ID=MMETSP0009_2-20130614/2556_1 /TAXON_ID=210454 /ORGANISM="Grammatophora oceanica, Strain CCMP 410" /LENGTH=174 /DNA_ID=CAMNT_0038668077 /DNA_START=54 /DNA_END=578 /DNA_ORIENTATION=+